MTSNDPVEDYWRATEFSATVAKMQTQVRCDREDAVHRMHVAGLSYVGIAKNLGLSKARVQQLAEAGKKRATITDETQSR